MPCIKDHENGCLHCCENIHNIIKAMLGDLRRDRNDPMLYFNFNKLLQDNYCRDLTPQQCVDYTQEYGLYHIPQVQEAIQLVDQQYGILQRTRINVLDLFGGPLTVELAFYRLLNRLDADSTSHCEQIKFTAVDKQPYFSVMAKKFKKINKNEIINISNPLTRDILVDGPLPDNHYTKYDWVIIANGITALFSNVIDAEIDQAFEKLINSIPFRDGKVILSVIETKGDSINVFLDRMTDIEFKQFNVIETGPRVVNQPLHRPYLQHCDFTRSTQPTNPNWHIDPTLTCNTLILERI